MPRLLFATLLGLGTPTIASVMPAVPQTPEAITARFDAAMAEADERVAAIIAVPKGERTYDNTIDAMDAINAHFDRDGNLLAFMGYVHPDAAMRDAARACEERWTNWYIDLGKNESLYQSIQSFADTNPKLDGEDARLLRFLLRDYRRAGMELSPSARAELTDVEKELNELTIAFDQNILDDATTLFLAEEELQGMPDDYIAGLTHAGNMYALGMDYPTSLPILNHSPNEETRQKMWLSRRRRAKANVEVLEKILSLRSKQAEILGFDHASDFENEIRMSKNADEVERFYAKLRPLLAEKAKEDFAMLTAAKREATGDPGAKLRPWDFGYWMERVRERDYDVDSNVVKEYFPFATVRDGIFEITQNLYGIDYRPIDAPADAPLWHEDVEYFEVVDRNTGEVLGEFTMDMYPREGKYGHAAQWGIVPRKVWPDGSVQRPVAALVCNFPKPTKDRPSLLTHDQAETFFHEFGHCLHTLLTETDTTRFAGTSVERDFVEAPSQMLESWVWSPETLPLMSGHYETGEPLPTDLLERMIAAKSLCKGMLDQGQVWLGSIDQAYHTSPDGDVDTTQVGLDMVEQCTMFEAVPNTWFQAGFGHLTGYQGGYYGYLWSKVFAEDMAERFKELGMLNPEAGAWYREKVLSRGGSADASDMLRDYLGREPKLDAYIRSLKPDG
ncbi:MAG: Zn-dependent oligopeptidase [Planctomycetes bacterium]|nr:Zn-dependent oligopeptidase [Planctomycetota bacterium]